MNRSQFLRNSARAKRRNPTYREWQLWQLLRRGQIGARFLRQYPMAGFILDFYCPAKKLAIEIDGPWHRTADGGNHDAKEERTLTQLGVTIIRLPVSLTPGDMRQTVLRYVCGDDQMLPATAEQLQTLLDGVEVLNELKAMPKKPAEGERRRELQDQLRRLANSRR